MIFTFLYSCSTKEAHEHVRTSATLRAIDIISSSKFGNIVLSSKLIPLKNFDGIKIYGFVDMPATMLYGNAKEVESIRKLLQSPEFANRTGKKLYFVISHRYGKPQDRMTLEAIGKELGISKERVRQIVIDFKHRFLPKNTQKKLVYVAGPYTANNRQCTKQNIGKAEKAAKQLLLDGYIPIIPHKITSFWEESIDFNHDDWLKKYNFPLIKRCDIICFIDGWKESEGCRMEYDFAVKNGKKIMFWKEK